MANGACPTHSTLVTSSTRRQINRNSHPPGVQREGMEGRSSKYAEHTLKPPPLHYAPLHPHENNLCTQIKPAFLPPTHCLYSTLYEVNMSSIFSPFTDIPCSVFSPRIATSSTDKNPRVEIFIRVRFIELRGVEIST